MPSKELLRFGIAGGAQVIGCRTWGATPHKDVREVLEAHEDARDVAERRAGRCVEWVEQRRGGLRLIRPGERHQPRVLLHPPALPPLAALTGRTVGLVFASGCAVAVALVDADRLAPQSEERIRLPETARVDFADGVEPRL